MNHCIVIQHNDACKGLLKSLIFKLELNPDRYFYPQSLFASLPQRFIADTLITLSE